MNFGLKIKVKHICKICLMTCLANSLSFFTDGVHAWENGCLWCDDDNKGL